MFLFFVCIGFAGIFQCQSSRYLWTAKTYPDIRAKPFTRCGRHVPKFGYICDPDDDGIISEDTAASLNKILYDLAVSTKCKCQRRSQCVTETGQAHSKIYVGFVVAVAFAKNLAHSTMADNEVYETARKFTEDLRERWGFGDCGNSAVILIWEEQQTVYISRQDSLTKDYITDYEAKTIVKKVEKKIKTKDYLGALIQILDDMKKEFNGEPEQPIDVGTVALILASTLAIVVVLIIVGCVCAFRCFGNLNNQAKYGFPGHKESIRVKLNERMRDEIIFNESLNNYFGSSDDERVVV